jgi:FKBP-type peptidyl-prolyl cis-trans isomerase FkpA
METIQPISCTSKMIAKTLRYSIFCLLILACALSAQAQVKKAAAGKKAPVKKAAPKKIDKTKFTPGLAKLASGIRYKFITKGTGTVKPKPGDYILMHIRVYVSDSMTFDSYKLNDNVPVPSTISKPSHNGDIMEGIAMMVEGDSAIFEIAQDSMYRNGYKPPFAKEGDPVKYQIKLIEVRTKEQWEKERAAKAKAVTEKQKTFIDEYIARKNLKNVIELEDGLRVAITQSGSGERAQKGQKVSVNYTGMLLDGTVFDSSVKPEFMHVEPYSFELGVGRVIKGWDIGLQQLNKGAKAVLLIPSPLAYGENGAPPKIGANTVLVFEVEMVDITK